MVIFRGCSQISRKFLIFREVSVSSSCLSSSASEPPGTCRLVFVTCFEQWLHWVFELCHIGKLVAMLAPPSTWPPEGLNTPLLTEALSAGITSTADYRAVWSLSWYLSGFQTLRYEYWQTTKLMWIWRKLFLLLCLGFLIPIKLILFLDNR